MKKTGECVQHSVITAPEKSFLPATFEEPSRLLFLQQSLHRER